MESPGITTSRGEIGIRAVLETKVPKRARPGSRRPKRKRRVLLMLLTEAKAAVRTMGNLMPTRKADFPLED
jgi:hypothetical protein